MHPNYFGEHDLEDFSAREFDYPRQGMKIKDKEKLTENIFALMRKLEYKFEKWEPFKDYSVGTGSMGIVLLYFHLYKKLHLKSLLEKAYKLFAKTWRAYSYNNQDDDGPISFLRGKSGILAIGAIICHECDRKEEIKDLIECFLDLHDEVIKSVKPYDLDDFAGYLYSMLLVNDYLGNEVIPKHLIEETVFTLLHSGMELAKLYFKPCPLWFCRNRMYKLGVSDNLSGILSILLFTKKYISSYDINQLIEPTISYLREQFSSDNSNEHLVIKEDSSLQWCDGAVGFINLMNQAYNEFKKVEYLQACDTCEKLIDEHLILKKSGGLCGGMVGNAYSQLAMYQLTSKDEHIYKAHKLANWCCEISHPSCFNDNDPIYFSHGLAGTIYFLTDLIDPMNTVFPGIQLLKNG